MALLKIFWTSTAIKQRNYIFEYWNERNKSKSYSQKLNLKIKERTELLNQIQLLESRQSLKEQEPFHLGISAFFTKKLIQISLLQHFGTIDRM
jgi:toxin YoeB